MSTRVFVLRPEPGLSATMERGRAMGLSMEAMPLSAAEPVAWDIPPGSFDGMLLGSANGLRHAGERLADLGPMPVYAVGEATAEEARARGLPVAMIGSGGLQGLLDALPGDRPLSLLRLSGAEHLPVEAPPHVTIASATVYAIVHHPLGASNIDRLGEGGVVLLHSGGTARHFENECRRTGIDRSKLALATIGPRVARSVSDGWKSLRSASTPDDAALLSLADIMCH